MKRKVFKVGDTVYWRKWNGLFIPGKVIDITNYSYPIIFRGNNKIIKSFTKDGRITEYEGRSLFFQEFDPPSGVLEIEEEQKIKRYKSKIISDEVSDDDIELIEDEKGDLVKYLDATQLQKERNYWKKLAILTNVVNDIMYDDDTGSGQRLLDAEIKLKKLKEEGVK